MLSEVLQRFTVRQVLRVVVVGGSVVYHREKTSLAKARKPLSSGALLRVGENVLSRTNGECDARKERAAFRERVL